MQIIYQEEFLLFYLIFDKSEREKHNHCDILKLIFFKYGNNKNI